MPARDGSVAHDLVSAARDLIRTEDPATAGLWPRAAALLARQALESAMDGLWRVRAPGLSDTSARCQLLCLGEFLRDGELAGRVHAAYEGLSRGCHVRVYELPPTAEDLDDWLSCVWELAEAVSRVANSGAASG